MADYFKVSIDFLLTGLRFSQLEDSNRFIDKNTLHIVQYKGNKILSERLDAENKSRHRVFTYKG